jgi:hypothetical protein
MKNILATSILTALVVFIATSCKPKNYEKYNFNSPTTSGQYKLDSTSQYFDRQYRVCTLEGCEYIVVGSGRSQWGSHKGNCKNPIHYTK